MKNSSPKSSSDHSAPAFLNNKTCNVNLYWKNQIESGTLKDPHSYLHFALQKVSRTFALNIEVLPAKLKSQVLTAYLFCRMADTIEDDKHLTPQVKVKLLNEFQNIFPLGADWPKAINTFKAILPEHWSSSDSWDQFITFHCYWVFKVFSYFPDKSSQAVSKWVKEMCHGMCQYIERRATQANSEPFITTIPDLDNYCYYVAGTVGHLLCDLFQIHTRLINTKKKNQLESYSVSFGLGLQYTNILKDICADAKREVLFIPDSILKQNNITAKTITSPENRESAKRAVNILARKAVSHLVDALKYTCLLPRLEPRLRLFCLWPLFMAADTLILLGQSHNYPCSGQGVKIKRAQVKKIILQTSIFCTSNFLIKRMFKKRMAQLESLF